MMSAFDHGFFDGYDKDTRYFYAQIFFRLELNIIAKRRGIFNVLLADSFKKSEWQQFEYAIPTIVQYLQLGNTHGR